MSRARIVREAKRIAKGVKKPYVTSADLIRGGLTTFKVMRHFDRWTELYAAAGLKRYPKNVYVPDEKIFTGMRDAFLKLGGVKTRHQLVKRYGYSSSTLMLRFGKWRDALVAFRRWCEANEPGFAYLDELPTEEQSLSPPSPQPSPAPGRERGADQLEPPTPEASESDRMGDPPALRGERGPGITRDRFSRAGRPKKVWSVRSGRAAVVRPGGAPGEAQEKTPGAGRREMGAFINFRWLSHAPVNEAGVILLFGMIAGEIGYSVDTVQGGFPDCEGKRRVSAERWERVRIEFEYRSRNFVRHQHDPKGCDLIVCWEHDWAECPLEVIELKSAIRSLPAAA